MKVSNLALLTGIAVVVLTGCRNPDGTQNNTGSGALIGGALGAITGAAIGGHSHGGQDALFGLAAGAVAGGLVGNSMDREQEARLKAQAPQTYARVDQGQPLSVADVKALAAAKVGDDVIINQIRNSHTVFHLSSADIIDLKDSGVDEQVMDFMINTPTSIADTGAAPTSQTMVADTPPPPPTETVVVAPGPGYVWVDGEWIWNGRWVWVGGHWSVPPYPHAIWFRGGWARGPHGYRRVPGHWG